MATTSASDPTVFLVREGWNHLMSQRPLAAWGSWQRALRLNPDSAAARQALETLESAPDLPHAARKVYRFRKPHGEARRAWWDREFENRDLTDLSDAVEVFERLTEQAPDDADAWYNQALCLAWQGKDRLSIECLDRVVALEAEREPKKASEAWTLAEVLRQGGGAESLSDDLRYACTFQWRPEDTPSLEASFPELRRIPTPRDPTRQEGQNADLEVFEWLDRPFPPTETLQTQADLPRVLATVYISLGSIRLSSPRVDSLERVEEKLRRMVDGDAEPLERVAAPLPLPFLDADVWTTRHPESLDRAKVHAIGREAVESYYENDWIHRPRQGLDGLSPLAASRNVKQGDAEARAKLEGVVRLREQLGSRPSATAMYQGYPFDRLRRRLDLEPVDPDAIDRADLSCASLTELQALSPEELDELKLREAFESANGLRDDPTTTRFAAEIVRRRTASPERLDLSSVYAPLVRQHMQRGQPEAALRLLAQARDRGTEEHRRTFDTCRAEILARSNRPDEAAEIYRSLVASSPTPSHLALDAAETLLDNGHHDHAHDFLIQARDLARTSQVGWIQAQAKAHLKTHYAHRVK